MENIKEIINEYYEIGKNITILEAKRDALRKIILEFLEKNNIDEYSNNPFL